MTTHVLEHPLGGLSPIHRPAPEEGNRFEVVSDYRPAGDQPTADAAAGLSVALTDPSEIAAASLAQTGSGAGNTGTGTISAATVTDPASWIPGTYTLTVTAQSNNGITAITHTTTMVLTVQ